MAYPDRFTDPIPLPRRKPLVTVLDAARYITGLPENERRAEYWKPAATLLKLAGESPEGGGWLMVRIAVVYGLRKGE